MTHTALDYFLSKQSVKEIHQRKAKEWSRYNSRNSCGQYTQKSLKEEGGINVDFMLLE